MKNTFSPSSLKVQKIFECLNETRKKQFGMYRKTIFHLHTPVSHDYKWGVEENRKYEELGVSFKKNIYKSFG